MQFNKDYRPQIPQPLWLAQAHAAYCAPNVQQAGARAAADALVAGRSSRAGCAHYARKDAYAALGNAYAAVDAVCGNASPQSCGLIGHVAHGLTAVGAAIVGAPTWLCRDVDVSIYVYRRIKELMLMPWALPCLVSAGVGLAAKAAATWLLYPAVFAASWLLNAAHRPAPPKAQALEAGLAPPLALKAAPTPVPAKALAPRT